MALEWFASAMMVQVERQRDWLNFPCNRNNLKIALFTALEVKKQIATKISLKTKRNQNKNYQAFTNNKDVRPSPFPMQMTW